MPNKMKVPFYLVVSKGGAVRTMKNQPNLSWDEISIHINLELPRELFQKPALQASINIPDEAAMPQTIEAETVANVKEAIESATGLEVRIEITNPE